MITSVGGFECGLEWEAVPCCPYRWHKRLIYLPSHQSSASSSVTKNLLLISNPNCKKKLSGLSVHAQPKSGADLTVCSFSAPPFEECLKRWMRRSGLKKLRQSCFIILHRLIENAVLHCWRSRACLGWCDWYYRQTCEGAQSLRMKMAAECSRDYRLSVSSIAVFFFFSLGLSSDLASFLAEFSDQGREAWNRLAHMWTPDSVTAECADCLIDAAWLRSVQRVTEQFIWFWFTSASTLWNSGLQKQDGARLDPHLAIITHL